MTNSRGDRSPRFTKAIFGRILAVLGFVALGTLAVIQSISGNPLNETGNESVASLDDDATTKLDENGNPITPSDAANQDTDKPGAIKPDSSHSDLSNPGSSKPGSKAPPVRSKIDQLPLSRMTPTNQQDTSKKPFSSDSFVPKPKTFNNDFPKPQPKQFDKKKLPTVDTSLAATKSKSPPTTLPSSLRRSGPESQTSLPVKPKTDSSNAFDPGGFASSSRKPASQAPSLDPTIKKPIVVAKQATPTGPPSTFPNRMTAPSSQTSPLANQTNTQPPTQPTARPASLMDQGSFGGRPQNPPAGVANKSLSAALNDPSKKINEISKDLTSRASNAINSTLDRTRGGINTLTDSAKSTIDSSTKPLRSSFEDQLRTNPSRPIAPATTSQSGGPLRRPFDNSSAVGQSRQVANPSATARGTTQPPNSYGRGQPSTRTVSDVRQFDNRTSVPPSSPPARQPIRSFTPTINDSRVSSLANASGISSSANIQTSNSPGDRILEGVQSPALTIEKIAPREIQVDQPADFQIVVRNSGRATAQDVQVFDMIPKGTEFVSAAPQPNRTNAADLRWSLGELRPGQEKRIRYQLKPIQPGEIGSVAHVTFSSQASMRTRVTKPVLQIKHTAQPKVLIGDKVVFDIVVENKGDGPANSVMIEEDVPPQLEFSDGTRELEYPIGTLGPGQSRKLKLALKAAQIGRLKNVLIATAAGNLRAQHALDMEVIAPQLYASGTGPKRKYLKREATHQFSVENKGTADATNVELIARLPSGLKFLGANNRGKYDSNTHAVYWSLAELTPNVVGTVELKTVPVDAGEQRINFEAFADLKQKVEFSQTLLVEHLVDVFFEIDDVVDPIEIGSSTSYRIRIQNQGTMTATNIRFQVDFPNGIQPTSVDGNLPNQINGRSILFEPISSMNPGDELKIIVNGRGISPGDHTVSVRLQTDGRSTPVSKEETTRVYNDR